MNEQPNQDQFQAFAARGGEGPVTMLNLIKLKPDGGRAMYLEYVSKVQEMLAGVGGKAVFAGQGAELLIGRDDENWDFILLIQYPKRQSLIDMATSPAYKQIRHLRDDSLERSVLLAMDAFTPS